MATIVALRTFDIRFPTSKSRDGSDAMNPDPDYSAAYVELSTDDPYRLGRLWPCFYNWPRERRAGRRHSCALPFGM